MPVETAADRAVFVSADDFGVTAYISQNGAAAVSFAGIFDNAHLMVDAGNAGVSSTAPVITCRTDDLAGLLYGNARSGDQIRIGSDYYTVTDVQADGTGMTTLIMEKVDA